MKIIQVIVNLESEAILGLGDDGVLYKKFRDIGWEAYVESVVVIDGIVKKPEKLHQ